MNKNQDLWDWRIKPKQYSILGNVNFDDHRESDGKLHFKIVYPGIGFVEWKQSTSILEKRNPLGYELVDHKNAGSKFVTNL